MPAAQPSGRRDPSPQPLPQTPLLAVPNISEGRDAQSIATIAAAFAHNGAARVLDVHSDPDHHRAVLSLAGRPGTLAEALAAGAAQAVAQIDVGAQRGGQHPHVGAVDVVPVVYLDEAQRGAACAEALVAAHLIGGELGVPVLVYGELAQGRTRAELRRRGVAGLARRLASGELRPDFGPRSAHARAGVTLVAARRPLVAFNLELAPPADLAQARAIAAAIREGGSEGLPGLRAIGVELRGEHPAGDPSAGDPSAGDPSAGKPSAGDPSAGDPSAGGPSAGKPSAGDPSACGRWAAGRWAGGPSAGGPSAGGPSAGGPSAGGPERAGSVRVAQVSMNVERPGELPLAEVVAAVRRQAAVARAEIVGLVPRAALRDFPPELPIRDFDPGRQVIENALGL